MVELKNSFFSSVTSYRFNYPVHAITVNIPKIRKQSQWQSQLQ